MSNRFTRREWLRAASAGVMGAAAAGAQGPRAQGPNVLMIAVDDLNDWIGVLGGHPQAVTPNIDRLAKQGVTFRRAYCQAPMCNPSRASLMTGIRPSTSAVYGNNDVWRDGLPNAVSLSEHFRLHGYEVLGGGKIFHGNQNEARSWDYYYNTPGFLHPADEPVNGLGSGHFDWGALDVPDAETADTMLAEWASGYLRKKHNRPFFLAPGFYRPHLPWYVPRAYFDQFPEERTELPAFLENDLDDVPKSAIRSLADHEKVTGSGQWKRAVAAYLACIRYADENVGRVMKALEEGPNAGNTIVVLWTDHGWHLGEKKHWRKFTLWEESCRVAMIVAGHGVAAKGEFCDRTVELLDIYPTLLDMAGLPARKELEGASLKPLLQNPRAPWDRPAMTHLGSDKATVRTERWRYTTWPDGEELYDHDNDPQEWTNLASRPEHRELKRHLAAMLPKNPSARKLKQWNQLPAEKRRLIDLAPGRHHKSDPDNYVPLERGPSGG